MNYTGPEIARYYDNKTTKEGLNLKLATLDGLFFNHSGILMPGQSIEELMPMAANQEGLLEVLHEMEKNLVRFGASLLDGAGQASRVLDAGCGAGGSALMIHEMHGSYIEGFTLSPEQVKFANNAAGQRGYNEQVKFFVGDMTKLDRPNDTYDFIWACESTEHVETIDDLFQEFTRVAKPGARLVVIAVVGQQGIHPDGERVKQMTDEKYLTDLHLPEKYLRSAKKFNWDLADSRDITKLTVPYWELRANSIHRVGTEDFLFPAFRDGAIKYYLFAFDLKK